jgi:hypothetical protein
MTSCLLSPVFTNVLFPAKETVIPGSPRVRGARRVDSSVSATILHLSNACTYYENNRLRGKCLR